MSIQNRTLYIGDNLEFLREIKEGSVDLIVTDPPFNSGKNFRAKPGSLSEGADFQDKWTDTPISELAVYHDDSIISKYLKLVRSIHSDRMSVYLEFMALRLVEMYRTLKDDGSIYLHCDDSANSYLRVLMDTIFGKNNFHAEITWRRTNGNKSVTTNYGRVADTLLYYSKSKNRTWNPPYTPYSQDHIDKSYKYVEENTGRRYAMSSLTAPNRNPKSTLIYEFRGMLPPLGREWSHSRDGMKRLISEGRLIQTSPDVQPKKKLYLDEMKGVPLNNVWVDVSPPKTAEKVGYPTQKPVELLERLITTSSNEGDIILDPFVGSGTALLAAEKLGRQWIGMDLNKEVIPIVLKRFRNNKLAVGKEIHYQRSE